MPNCAVFGCNNTNKNTKGTQVKFYSFPKNNDLAQQWLQACCRKDKVNFKNATVCSHHFTEDSLLKPLKHKLLNYSPSKFRNLKPDAVPTINLPKSKEYIRCTPREQRQKVKERKSLVNQTLNDMTCNKNIDHQKNVNNIIVVNSNDFVNNINVVDKNDFNSNVSEYEQMERKLLEMENKFKIMEKENSKLKIEINELIELNKKNEIEKCTLYDELKNISQTTQTSEVETQVKKLLGEIFSPGQIKALMNRNKKVHWNSEDISCAISLRSVSAKAYRYLRNKLKFPLPALSSLRRWVSTFECSSGILKHVILLMEHNGRKLTDYEKITALSFDEMSLSKQICFEQKYEQIVGPHSHVQVVMARGITSKWKQPIYYDYDKPMEKEALFEIIELLEKAGFKVFSITSDMGGENRALWNKLGISASSPSFANPYDPSREVFVFADAPHLLKLARNHFVQKGFVVCGNEHITIKCLEDMLNKQQLDLKVAFKLTKEHIYVKPKDKQNVKLAAQFFSNSTANALRFHGEKGLINGNWKDTADILQLFNNWFDLLNSNVPYTSQAEKNAFGINLETQKKILEEMSTFIEDSRVFGSKTLLPFQHGILLTNKSLIGLFDHLSKLFEIQYLLTAKLNQDVLENLFSFIRSMGRTNDHPDALQFKYRMRWFIMGKHSSTMLSVKTNTAPDTEECMTSNNHILKSLETEEVCPTAQVLAQFCTVEKDSELLDKDDDYIQKMCDANVLQSSDSSDIIRCEGLRYLTGYVAFKLKEKYPELGTKTRLMPSPESPNWSWIETMSKGGLHVPSDDFFYCAQIIEESFSDFHGKNDLRNESRVIHKVICLAKDKLKNIQIPEEAVRRLILVRTYIRIRHINSYMRSKKDDDKRKWIKKVQKYN